MQDQQGEEVESGKVGTSREALSRHFAGIRPRRIVIEAGIHANWVRTHLEGLGHEVIGANHL